MHIHFTRQTQDSTQNAQSVSLPTQAGPHRQVEYFQFVLGVVNGDIGRKPTVIAQAKGGKGFLPEGGAALLF